MCVVSTVPFNFLPGRNIKLASRKRSKPGKMIDLNISQDSGSVPCGFMFVPSIFFKIFRR